MSKRIIYLDMDGCICDFEKAINELNPAIDFHDGTPYEVNSVKVYAVCLANPFIFHHLEPIEGAIEAVNKLFEDPRNEIYFLSTPMWEVAESYSGKRLWLERHFGDKAKDRLILSRRKDLNLGDYLIDDTTRNGAGEFTGEHIHFGQGVFPTWNEVVNYLNIGKL